MTYIYTKKIKAGFRLKPEELLDIAIFALILCWLVIYLSYAESESPYPKIAHTKTQIFMYLILEDMKSKRFEINILLAFLAASFWLRMLLMLRFT
jgi:hypothetical protein